ncbi:hypothetical protein O6H91_Y438300 [Diphasiastrum complanatum]|nr:hypothetical protein O6H91_Y438300 [Diphasiastrum complanatum]
MSTPSPPASLTASAATDSDVLSIKLRTFRLPELSASELEELRTRPRIDFSSILDSVRPIVDDVRKRGILPSMNTRIGLMALGWRISLKK